MDDLDRKTQSSNARLSSIGNLFSRAWQVYKSRFWTLVGITAILTLGAFTLTALIFFGGFSLMMLLPLSSGQSLPVIVVSVILAVLFMIIFELLPTVSVLSAIKNRKQRIGVMEALGRGWYMLLSFFWITVLTGLVMGLGPIVGLILITIGLETTFVMIMVILGTIIGFIFSIYFFFAGCVLVGEGKTGINALLRSKELVQGNWWSVLARALLISLTLFVIGFVLNLIPILGSLIGSLVIPPFFLTFLYLLYEDLRRMKSKVASKEKRTARRTTRSNKQKVGTN